jgi:hypothetical protein
MIDQRDKLDHFLPSTPVTKDMASTIRHIAKSQGVSLATVTRSALSLFLSRYDSETINSKGKQ